MPATARTAPTTTEDAAAYTKGPWLPKDAGVVSVSSDVICEAPIHYLQSRKNWDNNARLIAAAPDLLDALKGSAREMERAAERLQTVHMLLARELEQAAKAARAAIARAQQEA